MPNRDAARGEQESREILRDRTRAWWTAALSGQTGQPHPIHAERIKAAIEDGVLVVRGNLASAADREQVLHEIEELRWDGSPEIRSELEVASEAESVRGILSQTLMAVFESDEQAGFARGFLEGHAQVSPEAMTVVSAHDGAGGERLIREHLSGGYEADARRALKAGRSILVVTVDETDAFRVRELLDEETQSLETVVLPPRVAEDDQAAHNGA